MSDLVGNPEDRFSRVEAQLKCSPGVQLYEPTVFSQTSVASHGSFKKHSSMSAIQKYAYGIYRYFKL